MAKLDQLGSLVPGVGDRQLDARGDQWRLAVGRRAVRLPGRRSGPHAGKFTHENSIAIPYVSFNYPSVADAEVDAGQHTSVLFLHSTQAPTAGEAYVIDSGIATISAVVPIPEPATLSLLVLGGLALLRRKR